MVTRSELVLAECRAQQAAELQSWGARKGKSSTDDYW